MDLKILKIIKDLEKQRFGGPGSGRRPEGGSKDDEISNESIKIAEQDDRFKTYKNGTNQEKTLSAYCERGSQVNYDIREGKETPQTKAFIENMDKSLNALPDYIGEVYRGINDNGGKILENIKNNVGKSIEWNGYTSTSKDKNKVQDFGKDIFFTIKSKTGKDITEFSNIKSEQEVLFKRNTKYKIDSVNGNSVNLTEL